MGGLVRLSCPSCGRVQSAPEEAFKDGDVERTCRCGRAFKTPAPPAVKARLAEKDAPEDAPEEGAGKKGGKSKK